MGGPETKEQQQQCKERPSDEPSFIGSNAEGLTLMQLDGSEMQLWGRRDELDELFFPLV